MDKNQKLAQDIANALKREDVSKMHHCSTRLRLTLNEGVEFPDEALKAIEGVLGTKKSMDGYQIIIGNNVSNVYAEIMKLYGDDFEGGTGQGVRKEVPSGAKAAPKGWFETFTGAIAAIVGPVIPAVVASGLVSALISILGLLGISTESTTMTYLSALSSVALYFLPFLLAFTASKYFNVSPIMAIFMAGLLMYPGVSALAGSETPVTLFGIPVHAMDYSSSLIPIILTIWAMKYVVAFVEKIVPSAVRYMLIPLLTVLIMLPIAICVTGPIGGLIGTGIANGILAVYNVAPGFGVLLFSALAPLLVLTGSHLVLIPIVFTNMATIGYDNFIMPAFIGMNFSQFAVALAVFLKSKNTVLKQTASSCAITAFFAGVTEPTLYGLSIRLKRPLIATFIGCFANGVVCGLMNVREFSFAPPSFFAMANFIDPSGSNNFSMAILAAVVTIVVTFAATWLLGFEEPEKL